MNGTRYKVLTLIAMLVYAERNRSPEMVHFIYAWAAPIVQKIKASRDQISDYDGRPWLARLVPFLKTEDAANGAEPLIVLLIGVLLMPYSEPAGKFATAGFVTLGYRHVVTMEIRRRESIAISDAEKMMRQSVDRARKFWRRPRSGNESTRRDPGNIEEDGDERSPGEVRRHHARHGQGDRVSRRRPRQVAGRPGSRGDPVGEGRARGQRAGEFSLPGRGGPAGRTGHPNVRPPTIQPMGEHPEVGAGIEPTGDQGPTPPNTPSPQGPSDPHLQGYRPPGKADRGRGMER